MDMIRQESFYPLEIKELNTKKDIKELKIFNKIPVRDIAIFCNQFATIVKAGIPILQCLGILIKQTENKNLRKSLKKIYNDVQKGETLSASMAKQSKTFPLILIHMIESGELSGTLDISLERMGEHFTKEDKLKQKVKGAMTYPVIVLIVTIGIIYFLLTNVVPTFMRMFENSGAALPAPTLLLIEISECTAKNGIYILGFIALLVMVFRIIISKGIARYKYHQFLLKIPVIGKLQIKIISARFTRTMSTLLAAGVPLTQALQVASKITGNVVAEKGIMQVEELIKQGKGLYEPLSSLNIFPPMVIHMTSIGEESGSLDDMLRRTAEFYEVEVEQALQKLITVLEPAIIVILGGIVGFIVLSIALPMFDIMNTIH
jgi:type IV pilus assembly protein PilC